jgi:glycosyltransferase involved in cell wall biosynthesis
VEEFIEYAAYHRKVCDMLLNRGVEVEIAMLTQKSHTKKIINGITVEAYEVTTGSSFGWEVSVGLIRRLCGETGVDVVHFHGYNQPNAIPYLTATVSQHHIIVQNHGSALDRGNLKHEIWYRLIIPYLRHCSAVLSVDKEELDNLSSFISDQTKLHHLPNAIDPTEFKPSSTRAARHRLGLDSDTQYGLFVGRLTEKKGIEYLLDAVANLGSEIDLRLLLVYSGSSDKQKQIIEDKISDLDIEDQINMVGAVDHSQMSVYYNAADFCVFPSTSEGFGVVVLEAMACGTPVIASKEHLGGGHVTDGENCLITDPHSPNDISDSITRLLHSPDLQKRLTERGRKTVLEQYTYDLVIDNLIDRYKEATK